MNYKLHYDRLIERARFRLLLECKERHHIVPDCLYVNSKRKRKNDNTSFIIGNPNAEENLVYLTPEEHFVAHQLLVKIYLGNRKLIYALSKMCSSSGKNI